jgi:enoyl-CoA hydratase/carnithine racemase
MNVINVPSFGFRSLDLSMKVSASPAATTPAPILLRETVEGGVAVLTLNRPAARNSLSKDLIAELHAAIDLIGHDDGVRAVVIAANGSAFSAGHDLKEITAHRTDADQGKACFERLLIACSAMMQAIVALPKPVIAAVQGIATAAGCQLVASCDLAVASDKAAFATPGVDIGLFCTTPMVALTRNVAPKHAMEMLLTGEPVSAALAQQIGLINRVVPKGTERETAIALAQQIAKKSAHTLRLGKTAFYRQAEMNLADAYRYASKVMTENLMAEDADEGIRAFIDKRTPVWQDR